jgi:hypothetical protein
MNFKHLITLSLSFLLILSGCNQKSDKISDGESDDETQEVAVNKVDTLAYNQKLIALANGDTTGLWPVKSQPYPLDGAILPFKRIVAYYGNLYSVKMGVLGEYPPQEVWKRLNAEVAAWEKADPTTPVQPAVHYIAVVAQGNPNADWNLLQTNARIAN